MGRRPVQQWEFKSMNKLMMTVGSLALMALASPVLAQSTSNGPATAAPGTSAPVTPGPDVTAPNNSSINAPQDAAPMSSKDSTSAVAPASQPSDSMSKDDGSQKPMKMSHKTHHAKRMDTTKASGSKSTDHDAEQLNQQELGKLQ
jgi:hypothetical protein